MNRWVLKRRHYSGAGSVVAVYFDQGDAQEDADTMNSAYQSTNYYTEPYDPAKAVGFTNATLVNDMVAQIWGQ